MKNVNIKSVDFLSTASRKGEYDVIILNPPFSSKKEGAAGGGGGLWKRFLTHALKSATDNTRTICFVPRTTTHIGFEHEVLIDEVRFDNASTSARVIMITGKPVKIAAPIKETIKDFDVRIVGVYGADKDDDHDVFNTYGIFAPKNGTFKIDRKDFEPQVYTRQHGMGHMIVGRKSELKRLSKHLLDNSSYEEANDYLRAVRAKKNGMCNLTSSELAKFINEIGVQ